MVCNATLTMNRSITLIKLAKASVARTMFGMPVLVLSGCRCGRSHRSALRNQDDEAAQVAGLGAFVDRRGVASEARAR